ncbi:MerR family transcriptional regulator [Clostridium celatum]|uniref:Transcriptional regulator, MerR family n=1 Tax=Clostridium celatum DSM 1785 TaxID=545697 RepID=L1QMY2_9CLOT|nr:MerR family transcriptional regulator [Clostridium celatum]EKY28927.1 transcriptional regulator, MerR family [Clostridium celatum DSM 1785]MCE9655069.1 MerR family transcriptional regulator [Clostridium celatum]MDU2266630.1 MerR family transcriptional regulator [Clostridium celatum]MDU6296965.1 MerR family transcriptional regulator [Clostridium celatum]MDY3360520.1 MerR family transcriptional regulator [Clostridium celatum]
MKTKYSIGKVAKIHNMTIESLRHYDRVGLLKPSYINEDTGYRYYSAKDFVILDLIKQCKSMGLSLDEIKIIIENYTSLESVLDVIGKQKNIIDTKINELNRIKDNINFLEERIKKTLEEGLNRIFIKEYSEREFVKYNNTNRFTEEFEVNLSKALAEVEKDNSYFNKELAFIIDHNEFIKNNKIIYKNMMLSFSKNVDFKGDEKIVIPAGKYLTLNFDDDYNESKKYYNIIFSYIKENDIKVIGDFYEIYIITRVGSDGREKSLGKLQIRIDN